MQKAWRQSRARPLGFALDQLPVQGADVVILAAVDTIGSMEAMGYGPGSK